MARFITNFIKLFFLMLTVFSTKVLSFTINKNQALNVLSRNKRANNGVGEELRRSNLDRECASEDCDREEYDEIFENFVTDYRKMHGYGKNLFEAYQSCKPVGGVDLDVEYMGDCIKTEFAKLP